MYDYLIVGAGLFGSVFARQSTDAVSPQFRVLSQSKTPHFCRA